MFRKLSPSLLCCGIVLMFAVVRTQQVDAQVIASETFSYADTTGDPTMDITDVGSGGTGWTGDWFNDGSSGGLSFQINASGEAEGDLLSETQKNYRQLPNTFGAANETIYIRVDFLDQNPDDSSKRDVSGIALHSSVDASLFLSGSEEIFLGPRDDFARLGGPQVDAGSGTFDTDPGTTGGDDTFLLQIDFDAAGDDSLTAWTFDDPASFNPATATKMTATADFTFNGIRIVKNGADHLVNIDNLYVGRSIADVHVTQVPEPTSLVLSGLGVLLIAGRCRRARACLNNLNNLNKM